MQEIWKDIQGYEGLYQVSNLGRVRRLHKDYRCSKYKIISIKKQNNGYYRVCLSKYNKNKYFWIHRLVAQAFIPNPNNYPIVNHKDENPQNNVFSNLEWCTHKYNANYGHAREKMSAKSTKRKVNQYDLNGNYIATYNSIKEASIITNSDRRYISQCCKQTYRTCNNYYWRYVIN